MRVARLAVLAAAAVLPGALAVALAFRAGGFFPSSWCWVAVGAAVCLALLVVLAPRPFAGLTPASAVAAAALGLLGAWMLASAGWSHAPGRALLEFDRLLAYVLVFVLLAALPGGPARAAWTLRAVAVGLTVICVAGLATRLAPDVWSVPVAQVAANRLAYPITYWNALGLVAAAGLVLALHLTASTREPAWVRAAAAALPAPLACTLYFTFSRGAIAAGILGVLAYLVLGRPRALPTALASAGIAAAVAVMHAYGSGALSVADAPQAQAVQQGHQLARLLVACCVGAVVLRAALLPVDRMLMRIRLPRGARPYVRGALGVAAVATVVAFVAGGGPGLVERNVDRFLYAPTDVGGDLRKRLVVVSNNLRTPLWEISLDGFRREPLHGTGAGTFANEWNRDRPIPMRVLNAHSLYLETLGELGAVGLGLLALGLGAIVIGLVLRLRGPDGAVAAAALAATLTWLVHAGVDWDWQLAAVTVWMFGLAAAVLAAPAGFAAGTPGRTLRLLLALGAVALALAPLRTAQSQAALDRAVTAFLRGDCPTSVDAALDSLAAVRERAEPWELIAYCDVRAGRGRLALRAIRGAVARDPGNWAFHYGEALVRGSQRRDPRRAAARAHALNPREPLTTQAVRAFRTSRPAAWQRRALRLKLPGLAP